MLIPIQNHPSQRTVCFISHCVVFYKGIVQGNILVCLKITSLFMKASLCKFMVALTPTWRPRPFHLSTCFWRTRQLWDKFMVAAPTIPSAKLQSVAMSCPQVLLVCLPGLSQISELSRFKQKFSSLFFFLFHLRQKWIKACVCVFACMSVCVPNKPKMMSEVFIAKESFFQLKVLIHVLCCCCPFSNYSVTTLLQN